MSERTQVRVNTQIVASTVRIIDENGVNLGLKSINEALQLAERAYLDLVEVSGQDIPVCKIVDYGKFKYDEAKKKRLKAKKDRENKIEIKEIRLRPVTEEHDLEIKLKQIQKFLAAGNKVKLTMRFKGRESQHFEKGYNLLEEFLNRFGETVQREKDISFQGRNLTVVIQGK